MKDLVFTLFVTFVSLITCTSCKKCVTCHTEGNTVGSDTQKHCAQNSMDIDAFTASYAGSHNGFDTHAVCD